MKRPANAYTPRLVTEDFVRRLQQKLEQFGEQRRLAKVIGMSETTLSKFMKQPPRSSRVVEPICNHYGWQLSPEGEDMETMAAGRWFQEGTEVLAEWGPEGLMDLLDWVRKYKAMKRVELEEARKLAGETEEDE